MADTANDTNRGRAAITLRLPPDLAERVEHLRGAEARSANVMVTILVREALDARDARDAR